VHVNATRELARAADERGGILVLTALMMPVLVLLISFVVDIGNWWVHKRHLQLQADAAALAGGARFNECFANPATANATITGEATKYNGSSAAIYNDQVGGTVSKGAITVLYQSKTYAVGGPGPDDTKTDPPCDVFALDVKATEADLPLIFDFPGLDFVSAINAHARVELKKSVILRGSLPLAVPEVNPKFVTATFVDASGNLIAGPVNLTGPTSTGALNAWSGTATVNVPDGGIVGVRIGMGQVSGACAAANRTGGTGYVCYDYSKFDTGLATIAGFSSGGSPAALTRSAFEVWPATACSGSPFFSDEQVTGGATSCAASIQAVVHPASGAIDPAQVKTFNAKVTGPGFNVTKPLTYSGGVWSTGYAFDIPIDSGPYDVELVWEYQGGSKQSFPLVQRIYSGGEDSGPIKALRLLGGGGAGAPYALAAGSQTVTVDVGVEGTLQLTPPGEMAMLRLTGGSRTSALACDGPGANLFRDAIINGCQTPYQINPSGICPDPAPPAGPADCVPTQTGTVAGPTLQAMDMRFAGCPPYNWPTYPEGDPRIVKLLITDFSALGGSGTTEVPVTNIAAFYVAGWTGSKCASNPPPPFEVKKGAIWGHFIKYAAPDPKSTGTEVCDPASITPCIPVMTR
jgi:hypothetical protein